MDSMYDKYDIPYDTIWLGTGLIATPFQAGH